MKQVRLWNADIYRHDHGDATFIRKLISELNLCQRANRLYWSDNVS